MELARWLDEKLMEEKPIEEEISKVIESSSYCRYRLTLKLEGFKMVKMIKPLLIESRLEFTLRKFKYDYYINYYTVEKNRAYSKWTKEEFDKLAEDWGEAIVAEINRRIKDFL